MTTDQVIAALEAKVAQILLARAKEWLFKKMAGLFLGPVGGIAWFILEPIISAFITDVVIKYMDLGAYFALKTVVNRADAEHYVDTRRAVNAANESGDKDAIAKAEADEEAAFFKLGMLAR